MKKIKVGIIGSGNIGTDLLVKITRSPILECGIFAGRSPDSAGIKFAQALGVPVAFQSIDSIVEDPSCCSIVFDATSASAHKIHAPILKKLGKFAIDLTPAHVGQFCVPAVNLKECLECDNVNLVTCGGQATIPLAHAITSVHPDASYVEIVASIASRSAGPGTRANIDEFTQTTSNALRYFTGVKSAKAIIVLNPAEPPITMRNTIYAVIENPNLPEITRRVKEMETRIQQYVPGYRVILGPIDEHNRITTTIEVMGTGDYLPAYSGNLDIITCAAVNIAEEYARVKLKVGGTDE